LRKWAVLFTTIEARETVVFSIKKLRGIVEVTGWTAGDAGPEDGKGGGEWKVQLHTGAVIRHTFSPNQRFIFFSEIKADAELSLNKKPKII
jgi:hypothetical protein